MNEQALKAQMIPFPDIPTQKKIATFLSLIDSKIETNIRITTELDSITKAIYNYWFVQFDFPNEDGKPYKSSGGNMVWNDKLNKQIPESWTCNKLSDLIENYKSGDWGSDISHGNYTLKVTCFRGADINGLNGLEECKPPKRFILIKNFHKILNSHDVIVEISGGSPTQSTGRLGFITDETLARFNTPLICSNFCKALTLKNKKLLYNFTFHWNRLYESGVLFGFEGKTNGIKNLLFETFVNSQWTCVPADPIDENFYTIMENIQKKKQHALKENQ